MKPQKIHFIITGGTIDSLYRATSETAEPNKKSIIPHYIKNVIKPHFIPTYKTICMLDSGDITDALRHKMVAEIKKTRAKYVIITHGTNTMAKTARFIK